MENSAASLVQIFCYIPTLSPPQTQQHSRTIVKAGTDHNHLLAGDGREFSVMVSCNVKRPLERLFTSPVSRLCSVILEGASQVWKSSSASGGHFIKPSLRTRLDKKETQTPPLYFFKFLPSACRTTHCLPGSNLLESLTCLRRLKTTIVFCFQ
ncbi:hypothetical protein ElyMa_001208300 [Elysia marginata]|uniref:Uncharacterized protein n=1 Tax=Elysia marginata TaxID=1093978 RepID=A0AAV4I6U5_9GAST|nr:hypothetical protein ElyMa_001208300 [Elysia marginata]